MKILCTGSSGFLGQILKDWCEYKEIDFIGYDITSGYDILNRDEFMVTCMSEHPDVIVHAAAVADLYESDKNLDKNFSINVQGTYFVGRICSILNIPLIYISTCCAYGNQGKKRLIDESIEAIPTEAYAWSKLAGEKTLGCVGNLHGCILRLGTFYGPTMRNTLFNSLVIEKMARGQSFNIHGDGEQTRRYIHVNDVCEAIIRAAIFCKKDQEKDFPQKNPLPIFNILGDTEISVNETIDIVGEILKVRPKVRYSGQREGQIIKQQVACDKARIYLGWKQTIPYYQGMRECIEAFQRKIEAKIESDRLEEAKRAAIEEAKADGDNNIK